MSQHLHKTKDLLPVHPRAQEKGQNGRNGQQSKMSVLTMATVVGGLFSSPPRVPCSCSSCHWPQPGKPQAAHMSSRSPSLPICAIMAVSSTLHITSLILPPWAPVTGSLIHFSHFIFTSDRPPVRQLASQCSLDLRHPYQGYQGTQKSHLSLSQGLLPSCLVGGHLSASLPVGLES